tara:strand:- start:11 stop:124 length:114 start_codon:yes stop_codon:yes gene_type:complete
MIFSSLTRQVLFEKNIFSGGAKKGGPLSPPVFFISLL